MSGVWDGPRNSFTLFSICRAIGEADNGALDLFSPKGIQSTVTSAPTLGTLVSLVNSFTAVP
jgi:hypothetical protein